MFHVRPLKPGKDYNWDKKLLTDKQIDTIRIAVWEARQRSRQRRDSRRFPLYTEVHDRLMQVLCTRAMRLLNDAIRDRLIIGYRNF